MEPQHAHAADSSPCDQESASFLQCMPRTISTFSFPTFYAYFSISESKN